MNQQGLLTPNVIELETPVLGALMLEKDALSQVIEILQPASFYDDKHGRIYNAILRLHSANSPIDIVTVTESLKKTNELNIVGGAWYISQLTNRVASASNIEFHARIIQQKFIQRELIRISTITMNTAYKDDADVFDMMDEIEFNLNSIKSGIQTNKTETTQSIVNRTIKDIEEARDKGGILGASTGLKALDDVLKGIRMGAVYVIGGKSGMGKSASFNVISKSLAIDNNLPLCFFSLEMPSKQVIRRLLSDLSEINNNTLASGMLTGEQWNRLHKVRLALDERFIIDDTPSVTIQYLESKIKKLSAEGVRYYFIDYLQLMTLTPADAKGKSEESQLAFITSNIKRIAKKYDVAIFELVQLNRTDKLRGGDHRPVISDLKGSSSIEQNADVIIMIHRPEYYNELEINGKSTKGTAELIIVKHRDGETKSVLVKYIGWLTRFADMEEEEQLTVTALGEEQTKVKF